MNATKHLERVAVDAHSLNWTWDRFWQMHGDAIRAAEPYDAAHYHRLMRHLLALVTSGEPESEPIPVGLLWGQAEPWEVDDVEEVQRA